MPPFERDAGELGVKARRVADRRVLVVQVLVALGEEALDESIGLATLRGTRKEERFEGGLRRCRRR
jgi:hypothetical protein